MGYEQDQLTERIIQAIIQVHCQHGPGFDEIIYHNSMVIELAKRGIAFESEKCINIYYDNQIVGRHRLDLLVEGQVVLELKTVEELTKKHYAQVRSYLKAAKCKVGLLVNFATEQADFRRIELE